MNRRGLLFSIGSLAVHKSFVRVNETVILNGPFKFSDYSEVYVDGCKIQWRPWVPSDDRVIYMDAPGHICNCYINMFADSLGPDTDD